MNISEVNKALDAGSKRDVQPAIRRAVIEVLVEGQSWRAAAVANGVTESGIFRAIQRIKLARSTSK